MQRFVFFFFSYPSVFFYHMYFFYPKTIMFESNKIIINNKIHSKSLAGTLSVMGGPFLRLHHRPTSVSRIYCHIGCSRSIFQRHSPGHAANLAYILFCHRPVHGHCRKASWHVAQLDFQSRPVIHKSFLARPVSDEWYAIVDELGLSSTDRRTNRSFESRYRTIPLHLRP